MQMMKTKMKKTVMWKDNDHYVLFKKTPVTSSSPTNLDLDANSRRSVKRIRLRTKLGRQIRQVVIYLLCAVCFLSVLPSVKCNRPPRFLIDGQTEIVLRLKEGEETAVGKLMNYSCSHCHLAADL